MSSLDQMVPKDGFNLWFDTNSILELGPDLYYLYPVAMLDLLHNLKIWLFQELSYQSASESTAQPEGTGWRQQTGFSNRVQRKVWSIFFTVN